MQKTSCYQAPPLVIAQDQDALLRAECDERRAFAHSSGVNCRRDVEPEVDDQNQYRGKARVRDKAAQNRSRLTFGRSRSHHFIAIRTAAIARGYECPAVRAHAAL